MKNKGTWNYCRHCSRICITDCRNFRNHEQQSHLVRGTGSYGGF